MGLYRFVLQDKDGNTIGQLDRAQKRSYARYLNKPGDAQFDLSILESGITTDMISLGYSELLIYRGNALVWGGEIQTRQGGSQNDAYTYGAKGYYALLDRREVGTAASPRVFTATDASQIAWTLINESQSLTNGNFGLIQGSLATASTHDRTYQYANLKDALDGLTNDHINDGIDLEITPDKKLNTYYPSKGQTKATTVFAWGVNILDYTESSDASALANEITALGAGDGKAMLTATDDGPSYLQQSYRLRQQSLAFKDISDLTTLQSHATGERIKRQGPQQIVSIVVSGNLEPTVGTYDLGDVVKVQIQRGLAQINGLYRIYGINTTLDEQDMETVELTFNPS